MMCCACIYCGETMSYSHVMRQVWGQPSILPPHGPQGLKFACRAWQQAPLHTELPCQPLKRNRHVKLFESQNLLNMLMSLFSCAPCFKELKIHGRITHVQVHSILDIKSV